MIQVYVIQLIRNDSEALIPHSISWSITGCSQVPIDLLFVVDTSTSSEQQCNKTKDCVMNITSQLNIGPDSVRVAMLTYSSAVINAWNFDTFISNDAVLQAVESITCEGGSTMTASALEYARTVCIVLS